MITIFDCSDYKKKKDDGYSSFRTFQIQNISELQSEIEPPPF